MKPKETETTSEKLQNLARSMNSEKVDVTPYENLGVLVRVKSKEYRIRTDQQVMILAQIECDDEQFAYFMT